MQQGVMTVGQPPAFLEALTEAVKTYVQDPEVRAAIDREFHHLVGSAGLDLGNTVH